MMLDAWSHIAKFIERDKDRCHLMITCKEMLKCSIYFDKEIHIDKIRKLYFFNKFTNILVDELVTLSLSVTHLTFSHKFNQNINDCIPSSVTHLTLGYRFAQSIEKISSSVTHLTIHSYEIFKKCINGHISSSITHIFFKMYHWYTFDLLKGSQVPTSITHIYLYSFNDYYDPGLIKMNITNDLFNGITKLIFI